MDHAKSDLSIPISMSSSRQKYGRALGFPEGIPESEYVAGTTDISFTQHNSTSFSSVNTSNTGTTSNYSHYSSPPATGASRRSSLWSRRTEASSGEISYEGAQRPRRDVSVSEAPNVSSIAELPGTSSTLWHDHRRTSWAGFAYHNKSEIGRRSSTTMDYFTRHSPLHHQNSESVLTTRSLSISPPAINHSNSGDAEGSSTSLPPPVTHNAQLKEIKNSSWSVFQKDVPKAEQVSEVIVSSFTLTFEDPQVEKEYTSYFVESHAFKLQAGAMMALIVSIALLLFINLFSLEWSDRNHFIKVRSYTRMTNALMEQLHKLHKTYVMSSQVADFESPLEKAILICKTILSDPSTPLEHLQSLNILLMLLKSGDLMRPDLERQVEGGQVDLDEEQEAWLFSNLLPQNLNKRFAKSSSTINSGPRRRSIAIIEDASGGINAVGVTPNFSMPNPAGGIVGPGASLNSRTTSLPATNVGINNGSNQAAISSNSAQLLSPAPGPNTYRKKSVTFEDPILASVANAVSGGTTNAGQSSSNAAGQPQSGHRQGPTPMSDSPGLATHPTPSMKSSSSTGPPSSGYGMGMLSNSMFAVEVASTVLAVDSATGGPNFGKRNAGRPSISMSIRERDDRESSFNAEAYRNQQPEERVPPPPPTMPMRINTQGLQGKLFFSKKLLTPIDASDDLCEGEEDEDDDRKGIPFDDAENEEESKEEQTEKTERAAEADTSKISEDKLDTEDSTLAEPPMRKSKSEMILASASNITTPTTLNFSEEVAGGASMATRGVGSVATSRDSMSSVNDFNAQMTLVSLLERVDHWNWELFELNDASRGWPLFTLAHYLFLRSDLYSKLHIPKDTFLSFLTKIETGYHPEAPYHNSLHAADVLHGVNWLKDRSTAYVQPTDMELLTLYFAAIIHDYEYPGVNNNFLVATQDNKALMYNDRSVLENHHLASAFQVLVKPENNCNFLKHMKQSDYRMFRETVVELVLATDLQAQHFVTMSMFKNKVCVSSDVLGNIFPIFSI
ncbi:Calcium/calmodulin-dependent 3',5'-cyclic nucleotide phosphodiesterase 1C [Quaeritorhiza haematococci]|nr:Calcium/calmodulin-dependent 3',5'-cyclic nucleotide phosphodiesterase 1C [Quaeritorhiza haematococci]